MDTFITLAKYNQWMNNNLYQHCTKLGQTAIEQEQGAFFGSILRTLNHLYIGDLFWLSRCKEDPTLLQPKDDAGNPIKLTALDQIVFKDIETLYQQRQQLDTNIVHYIESLEPEALNSIVSYQTSGHEPRENPLNLVLTHWFNHQTHHRGQITTLLSQQGIDVGITDLIYIKDNF